MAGPESAPDEIDERGGADDDTSYADTKRKQDEFEQLVREKGDFQEATDAQLRGEEPEDDEPSSNVPM